MAVLEIGWILRSVKICCFDLTRIEWRRKCNFQLISMYLKGFAEHTIMTLASISPFRTHIVRKEMVFVSTRPRLENIAERPKSTSKFPNFQISNFPIFQSSIFPIFQFSKYDIFSFSWLKIWIDFVYCVISSQIVSFAIDHLSIWPKNNGNIVQSTLSVTRQNLSKLICNIFVVFSSFHHFQASLKSDHSTNNVDEPSYLLHQCFS